MVGLVLGLLSSLAYGVADFAGGVAARRAHVMQVVAVAAPASLVVELVAWPILGAAGRRRRSAGAPGPGWRRRQRSCCCTAVWRSGR